MFMSRIYAKYDLSTWFRIIHRNTTVRWGAKKGQALPIESLVGHFFRTTLQELNNTTTVMTHVGSWSSERRPNKLRKESSSLSMNQYWNNVEALPTIC